MEEWYETAYKRYSDDRTMWGAEADRGELSEVESHLTNVNARIKTLEWVLTDNTDTP